MIFDILSIAHFGTGSVCCSGALRARELLEHSRLAVRDRCHKSKLTHYHIFLDFYQVII